MDVASLPPDHNKGPMAEGLLWAFNGLAAILIALRAYTRIKTGAQGWDDYVAYFALVGFHHNKHFEQTLLTRKLR